MIQNVEQNLREFCMTQDSTLFTENLYEFLNIYAASIATKYKIKSNEIEEVIHDMVSHATIELPLKYKLNGKMAAKSMLYIIMEQWLMNKFRHDGRKKRNAALTVYIEELSDDNSIHLYEVQFDELRAMREILLNNKDVFIELETILQRKIAGKIIEVIEHEPNSENYIEYVAKQCKCSVKSVYTVTKLMRSCLSNIESLYNI